MYLTTNDYSEFEHRWCRPLDRVIFSQKVQPLGDKSVYVCGRLAHMVLLLDTSVLWENSCSEIRTEEDISTSVVIVIAKGILDVSSALYDILCTYFASFDETPRHIVP